MRHNSKRPTRRISPRTSAERLESRALLSAWATVDDFQIPGHAFSEFDMTSDAAGNVYASGWAGGPGILREKPAGSSTWITALSLNYNPTGSKTSSTTFHGVAVDTAGDLFLAGSYGTHWLVMERPAGQPNFSVVDDFVPPGSSNACAYGLTIDSSGDVFVVGQSSITGRKYSTQSFWTVRERKAGGSGFVTVDNVPGSAQIHPFTATSIASGANAGVYVVGTIDSRWVVRKSTDGGATWSTVDDFLLDPTVAGPSSIAQGVTADPTGTLYVTGTGNHKLGSGGVSDWIVRKSVDGGATWSIDDDFRISGNADAWEPAVDLAGNIYVSGWASDSTGMGHAIVRTNTGGTWNTVDDFQLVAGVGASGRGIAVDTSGYLYSGNSAGDSTGSVHYIVRSAPGPTAPGTTATTTTAAAVFSATQITTTTTEPAHFLHPHKHRVFA